MKWMGMTTMPCIRQAKSAINLLEDENLLKSMEESREHRKRLKVQDINACHCRRFVEQIPTKERGGIRRRRRPMPKLMHFWYICEHI
jgi:hypothetical protein